MTLDIQGDETYRLASRLAQITGESLDRAVAVALRERLERVEATRPLAEELLAIGRDCATRLAGTARTAEHGDLLYDERGLPH